MVVGLIMALVLAACGDDDDDRALSRAEFANQGNAICARHIKAIEDAAGSKFTAKEVPLADELDGFAKKTVIPELEAMREELRKLKAPRKDEDDFKDYLSELKRSLDDEVKHDPSQVISEEESQNAFVDANELANDAGLTECAKLSDRIRAKIGAPRGK